MCGMATTRQPAATADVTPVGESSRARQSAGSMPEGPSGGEVGLRVRLGVLARRRRRPPWRTRRRPTASSIRDATARMRRPHEADTRAVGTPAARHSTSRRWAPGSPRQRGVAQPALHGVEQGDHDLVGGPVAARTLDHVVDDPLERAAEADRLVGVGPRAAERRHDLVLGLQPERLAVDQGAVHVEQDGGRQQGPAHVALKYLASGWWTMIALVDCSGCSWNSSDSSTPMRSGSSRSMSLTCCSRSGQAG